MTDRQSMRMTERKDMADTVNEKDKQTGKMTDTVNENVRLHDSQGD